MFPHSKFIHIVRDGRDVALSVIKQWWGASDFITAIKFWAETVRQARKMLGMLPSERYIELKFEHLVAFPERELKKIADFLGVDYEVKMVSNYKNKALHKVGDRVNRHHKNLSGQLAVSQTYKWVTSLPPADQAIAFEIAGSCLTDLDYLPGIKSHPLKIFRKCCHRLKESYAWRLKRRSK